MLAILSGQYVNAEMALHFGRLPPAFLPVAARRLYETQLQYANGKPCLMTVPDDYSVPAVDRAALAGRNVTLFPMTASMSLAEAMIRILDHVDADGGVSILFGDTLVDIDPAVLPETDFVIVKDTIADYHWTFASETAGRVEFFDADPRGREARQIVCGYFCFSDTALLRQALTGAGNLSECLTAYARHRPLKLIEAKTWYDFGHLTLFYQSRRKLMVARSFNSLVSDGHSIRKTSAQISKIRAEAQWYESLPKALLLNVPRYIGQFEENHKSGYELEYLHIPSISDLFVFGLLSSNSWSQILTKCFDFLKSCRDLRPGPEAPEASEAFAETFFQKIFVEKTWDRLREFCHQSQLSPETCFRLNGQEMPPLGEIVEDVINSIPPTTPQHIRFWHGDFFFGNLFYDFNARRVIAIDPRGVLLDGSFCKYGDWRYDLGKLAHSILGGYDFTIAGRSDVQKSGPLDWSFEIGGFSIHAELVDDFVRRVSAEFGIEPAELHALATLMFFSMLPLHADDSARQECLLATGLYLYQRMRGVDA